ncbi:hypothetical protein PpBr36_06968 [Pyricularia pennisetigena]|uniref:hypothetical protein n=1 Tax=Pyricularia pennisetigena TaxID=1578925 RepID=UPI00114DC396|nr:hypothetical protein PpBr36_06968 [Pyricularia pennisetigena]TLS25059.1 hypothetical protein PpBr36_06968 [Pyricularia pennisetigena]
MSTADPTIGYACSYQDCLGASASYNRPSSGFAGRPSAMACCFPPPSGSTRVGCFAIGASGGCYLKNATRAQRATTGSPYRWLPHRRAASSLDSSILAGVSRFGFDEGMLFSSFFYLD